MELYFDTISLPLLAALMLGTGCVAGVLAGFLGVGGGIVIVPVLFHLFTLGGLENSLAMEMAVGTSLATIIVTSISSTWAHHKRGAVDVDLLKVWIPAVILGVAVGTSIADWIGGVLLTLVFATVALLVSLHMGLRSGDVAVVREGLPGRLGQSLMAFVIGAISVMMGIGGGTLSVTSMTIFGYPIRRAVGTAAALGFVIGVPGALGFALIGEGVAGRPPYSLGYINLVGFGLIVPATVLVAPVGARIAHAIPPEVLRKAFALFLGLTALRMYAGFF